MMPDEKIQEALSRIVQFCTRHCVSESLSIGITATTITTGVSSPLKVNGLTGMPTVKDTT